MADSMRVLSGGGIDIYMAASDETAAELLVSNDPLVTALRVYDTYFREELWKGCPVSPLPALMFTNAYQLFLAGVRMALSGHPAAVFPVLRTALESAAYGGLMLHTPELQGVWTDRHAGEAERKACLGAFTFKKAIQPLEAHAPQIHALAVSAYEASIDFGAHPNVKGVFSHVTMDDHRDDGLMAVNHTSLYGATHKETIRGLGACLDFGLAIIGAIILSFPDLSDEQVAALDRLIALKDAAVAPYSSPSE
ncbi:hypothetical protein FBZ89_109219 [Nitrospirillum amazonense]|uniref:Uncharacterized protein n=1 Tax=Nitrospirillum amazonense TaxID=28077 RepID=A0A560FB54_9PROT|nr:hypothetical protein [Nitrospirillum amazonense]TWB18833.1 hypothetical protein FBZ89_109219 [Nitrospirillum amazonense]